MLPVVPSANRVGFEIIGSLSWAGSSCIAAAPALTALLSRFALFSDRELRSKPRFSLFASQLLVRPGLLVPKRRRIRFEKDYLHADALSPLRGAAFMANGRTGSIGGLSKDRPPAT
jgi:hypothetical protein